MDAFLPVVMFSVLFGLSMDYEVYTVSRMQEEWRRLRSRPENAACELDLVSSGSGWCRTADPRCLPPKSGPAGAVMIAVLGSLGTSFGNGGTLTATIQGDEAAATVLIQSDGKIIAVGFSENKSTGVTDVFLARYLG